MSRDGKKTGGRDFMPGNSVGIGNSNARVPDDLKGVKKLNRASCERLLNTCIHLTSDELEQKLEDPSSSVLEKLVCKIVTEAIKFGDHQRCGFLLDRLIGKVTDKVEVGITSRKVIKVFGEDAAYVIGQTKKIEADE